MEENKEKKIDEESDSIENKFESIENEINILFKMIDSAKTSGLAYVFEKISHFIDKYGDKFTMKLQDKIIFEENTVDEYKLEEAIIWFKKNYKDEFKNVSGGLFKSAVRRKTEEMKLYHFFVDENDKKVLSGRKFPFKLIKTGSLDKELLEQFGDDDLVIFK